MTARVGDTFAQFAGDQLSRLLALVLAQGEKSRVAPLILASSASRCGKRRWPRRPFVRSHRPTPPTPADRLRDADRSRRSARNVGDATRRIEFDGGERPHGRPAQSQAFAHGLVEIGCGDVPLAHQAHRLGQQRALQAIEDEAVELAPDHHRHLSDGAHHGMCALQRRCVRPRRAAKLDDGDQMRRIHRMGDDTARTPGERLGEARRGNGRGRACENRLGRRRRVERGKEVALDVDVLGRAFLHPLDVADGGAQLVAPHNASGGVACVGDQAKRRLLLEIARDMSLCARALCGVAVEDLVRPAGACKDHCPGTADESRTNDCRARCHEPRSMQNVFRIRKPGTPTTAHPMPIALIVIMQALCAVHPRRRGDR